MAKARGKRPAAAPSPGPKKAVMTGVVVAVVLAAAVGLGLFRSSPGRQSSTDADSSTARSRPEIPKKILTAIPRRPRPPTLAPETFTEPVTRKSYEVAKANPELLEKMPCYCGCYSNPGHTNNLDCFVDKHGET